MPQFKMPLKKEPFDFNGNAYSFRFLLIRASFEFKTPNPFTATIWFQIKWYAIQAIDLI